MRMPPPRSVHEAPSGEYSKVVRQTSGLVPPRVGRVHPRRGGGVGPPEVDAGGRGPVCVEPAKGTAPPPAQRPKPPPPQNLPAPLPRKQKHATEHATVCPRKEGRVQRPVGI